MNLTDKIKIGINDKGIVYFACLKTDCKEKQFYNVKATYCCEEIPFVYRTTHRINIVTLCSKRIGDYFNGGIK